MSRARKRRNKGDRAGWEFVDVATGEAREPELAPGDGTAPTGRIVAEVDGEAVEVDPDDVLASTVEGGEHPRSTTWDYAIGPEPDYRARAAEQKRERSRARRRAPTKPRAVRATFDSSKQAAREFYDNNALFFDYVRDPGDGVREWMDSVEVRIGKRTRRLYDTAAGQRILALRGGAQIRGALAYVFGQAKGNRWDAVDWFSVERLEASLAQYFEGSDVEASMPGVYWRPVVGDATPEQLEAMDPAQRAQLAEWEAAEEIRLALAELRERFERNRDCLDAGERDIIGRRIEQWSRWADDPSAIPAYACEPDERTGGYTCNYPSVAGELRVLGRACERGGYDVDWAEPRSRAADPGFPDTSQGPADPPRDVEALELRDVGLRLLVDDGRAYGGSRAQVVERRELGHVVYQLEHRRCGARNPTTGKAWCHCMRPGAPGHGPYWYAYWRDAGGRRSRYLGTRFQTIEV